jgi:hypothetical protein
MFSRRLDNLYPGDPMPDLLATTPPPRRCAIPLMVELCAGTAALSLRLERAKARPPVSRMGAKTGYADAILALAGLNPGDKAEQYLWCEPDDGVRLLLHAYRDAELAKEAAAIIRSWADEDPRALWERLRAEGPAVCPPVDAREVARAGYVMGGSMMGAGTGPFGGNLEGWAGTAHGQGPKRPLSARLPDALHRLTGGIPATIHDDARTLDPCPGECWPRHDSLDEALGCMRCQRASERSRAGAVQVPPGTLAYIDPPYLNTTGYAHLFPRSEWVPALRRWADAGARCMVSEAEPIPELMADGWHAVEITAMRVGQKRTFSKQQSEWVTMNFEPDSRARLVCERALERLTMREAATVGGEQADLFGGA